MISLLLKPKIDDIFFLLNDNSKYPMRSTEGSAGFDLYTCHEATIMPGHVCRVGTGVSLNKDFFKKLYIDGVRIYGALYLRSGWAFKNKCIMVNSVGIIDMDYTYDPDKSLTDNNEIKFQIVNIGDTRVDIQSNQRIGQLIFNSFEDFEIPSNNKRTGGFGSTGTL
jgi:dUTP pyrophosphatase